MIEKATDRRNLIDEYKGLEVEQIVNILDTRRNKLHIAIENWEHDFNIGSIVRTANAFNVAGVHIVGRRRWNRRGAMMTDVYLNVYHHPTLEDFKDWADAKCEGKTDRDDEKAPKIDTSLKIVGIDILPGISTPIERENLDEHIVMLFGAEGSGLTREAQNIALDSSGKILHITQYGSTRSINAAHAASIAMYEWSKQNIKSC